MFDTMKMHMLTIAFALLASLSSAKNHFAGHWTGVKWCEVVAQINTVAQPPLQYTVEMDAEENVLNVNQSFFSTTLNSSTPTTLVYSGTRSNDVIIINLCDRDQVGYEGGLLIETTNANGTDVLVGSSISYHPLFSDAGSEFVARCYWQLNYVSNSTLNPIPPCEGTTNGTLDVPGTEGNDTTADSGTIPSETTNITEF